MNSGLRKAIIFLSAMSMILSSTGCGEKKQTEENGEMTISWLGIPWFGTGKEGGYAETLLEERYDIEIKPIFFDKAGYADKKSVTMLGGEIPDLIYELDPADLQSDANQRFIQEIPYEKIKELAPDYYNFINENCPEAWLYSNVDGKNYGLPNLDWGGKTPTAGIWRTDWLKNVGINKIPETIEEFHDALYKFRHNDPDGNGKKDTYGMTGDVGSWHKMFMEFFGAYGARPFSWVKTENGIEYGGLQDNVREALATLAQWYKEELIHPDFISDNVYDNKKFINGDVGYFTYGGGSRINDKELQTSLVNRITAVNPNAAVDNAYMPKGPRGEAGNFVWGYPAHVVAFGKDCDEEKLNKLLTIMNDIIKDEDLCVKLHIGDESKWKYIDESVGLDGGIEVIDEWGQVTAEHGMGYSASAFVFFAPVNASFKTAEKYTDLATKEYRAKYVPETLALGDYFNKADVVPSANKYFADLRNQQIIIMTKIIRGEQDISYYDDFVKFWETQGGEKLTQEANQLYETLNNIYSQVGVDK